MTQRYRIRIQLYGQLQGVGFRPAVFRLATQIGVGGCVGNNAQGAWIEIEGTQERLEFFLQQLESCLPPHARLHRFEKEEMAPKGEDTFRIVSSLANGKPVISIPPDLAVCETCIQELFDPHNRRYRYPFINCTNCGPRYSITQGVPYDRVQTTMAPFRMCEACQREYLQPDNRRFHAQPNACPVCGPQIWWQEGTISTAVGEGALKKAVETLKKGGIIAIKGLGGFHLACRADNSRSVDTLRKRKEREAKPFAIMIPDLSWLPQLVEFDDVAKDILTHWRAPIVVLPKLPHAPIVDSVAPGMNTLGVMLPYTPLHHLLLREIGIPLVMTSGNRSGEPLCRDNEEAIERLLSYVDGFLFHNRSIARRIDDSVIRYVPNRQETILIRRSRGFVPQPFLTPSHQEFVQGDGLAYGGDLKSVIGIGQGSQLILSEHLGDLNEPSAYRNYLETIELFLQFFHSNPQYSVCDLHPGYISHQTAKKMRKGIVLGVQHHHAHIEAVRVEYNLEGSLLGFALDGTGYGMDGTIWGGELLLSHGVHFQRLNHLHPFPLLGGDQAAKEPWRCGLSLLTTAQVPAHAIELLIRQHRLKPTLYQPILSRLQHPSPPRTLTSSLGRLFDGVAWIIMGIDSNQFEAQAPMLLETFASSIQSKITIEEAVIPIIPQQNIDWRPLIRELVIRVLAGESREFLALWFHFHLAELLARWMIYYGKLLNHPVCVLSGGCILNIILRNQIQETVAKENLHLYIPCKLPPGDGSIAAGQLGILLQWQNNKKGTTCAWQYPVEL